MPVFDTGFKIITRFTSQRLAHLAGFNCTRWQPIVSEVQTTERFADRAFRATYQGERCVVYFEAYTYWKREALWNILGKSGLLSEREELPTVCLIYILRPRGYRPLNGKFRLKVAGKPTQALWYHAVPLWQQRPQPWWDQCPGLMALYPLTDHQQAARKSVRHAAEQIEAQVSDLGKRADLLTTLGFFGKLAYPDIDMFALLGREEMKRSKFYDEFLEEGRQEMLRKNVLTLLKHRFGPQAAKGVKPSLQDLADTKQLDRLFDLALTCAALDDFRQELLAATQAV